MEAVFSFEPRVSISELRYRRGVTWEDVDDRASGLVGCELLAVPSIRVGILWVLEYLQLDRHTSDVLVPMYLSRCILNVINRRAFPVTTVTDKTCLVLLLNQFGFEANIAAVGVRLRKLGVMFLEDSPHGIGAGERAVPGSLGRFVSFSKVLPIIRGAGFISPNKDLVSFIKSKREKRTLNSWLVLAVLALSRRRGRLSQGSAWADIAYELYPYAGENSILQSNFFTGLEAFAEYEKISARRLDLLKNALGANVRVPDLTRLAYVVPFFAGKQETAIRAVFDAHGFDSNLFHFDVRHDVFNPRYEEVLLIPINPTIPDSVFERFIQDLRELIANVGQD